MMDSFLIQFRPEVVQLDDGVFVAE